MQGSDGRDSNHPGSDAKTHGDDAGHLVIRAEFHARSRQKGGPCADAGRANAAISFSAETESRAADARDDGAGVPPPSDISPEEAAAQREAAMLEIERLRLEHRDLDSAITALGGALADQLQVQRLKRRKLSLRDRIRQLEDQLTPDIIA